MMVSTTSSERMRQARIVESYIQSWGLICSGFNVESHAIVYCPRRSPLVVVLDAAEDECNVLCRSCADRRSARV
jgi:hypothetical protein